MLSATKKPEPGAVEDPNLGVPGEAEPLPDGDAERADQEPKEDEDDA